MCTTLSTSVFHRLFCGHRHSAHDAPRLLTLVFTELQTKSAYRATRPWNEIGDLYCFFILKSAVELAGAAPTHCGAQSPLWLWLRCPPSRATPIHTPIFSSPPARPCIVERPTPFTPNAILCLCSTTQNFMQWGLSPLLSEKRDLRYLSISGT